MSTGKKTFSIPTPSEMKMKKKTPNKTPLSEKKVAVLRICLDFLEEHLLTDRFETAVMRAMNNKYPNHSNEQTILFTFSSQHRQGENYEIFAFLKYDQTDKANPFQIVNMRPENHEDHIWYFDLVYLILGGEVNYMGNRSLKHPDNLKIGLKPVMDRLRDNAELNEKGYAVSLKQYDFFPKQDRESGVVKKKWVMKVFWGESKDRVVAYRKEKKGSTSASSSVSKPKQSPPKPEDFSATLEESKQKATTKPKITQKKD